MKLLDLFGVEVLKLLLERGQVGPRVRVEEAEQVEQLAHVVVQRSTRQEHLLSAVENLEPLEDEVGVALESLPLVDLRKVEMSRSQWAARDKGGKAVWTYDEHLPPRDLLQDLEGRARLNGQEEEEQVRLRNGSGTGWKVDAR